MKKTSSSLAATMKVSWSWPITAPKRTAPNAGVSSRNRAACGAARPLEERLAGRPAVDGLGHRAGERRVARALRRSPPRGQARLGLDDATRAKRVLHRGEERLLHEARGAKAHPRLGRMHVDVDLAARQLDTERGGRESVPREERPVGVDQRLHEERVAHRTAVDDDRDRVAVAARELRRDDEAGHRDVALPPIDVQHPRGQVEAPERAEPIAQPARARRGEDGLAVVGDPEMDVRMGAAPMPSRSRSAAASSVGARLEELEPPGRIEEEILRLDGGPRGGVHEQLLDDHAPFAAHEGPRARRVAAGR